MAIGIEPSILALGLVDGKVEQRITGPHPCPSATAITTSVTIHPSIHPR
jgi:hypothetical protein